MCTMRPSPDNLSSQTTQNSHKSRPASDQTPCDAQKVSFGWLHQPNSTRNHATLHLSSMAHSAAFLGFHQSTQIVLCLLVHTHNTTTLSSSRFHRSRHWSEVPCPPRLSLCGKTIVFATQTASKMFGRCNCQGCQIPVHDGAPLERSLSLTVIDVVRSVDQSLHRTGPTTDVLSGSLLAFCQWKMIHSNS